MNYRDTQKLFLLEDRFFLSRSPFLNLLIGLWIAAKPRSKGEYRKFRGMGVWGKVSLFNLQTGDMGDKCSGTWVTVVLGWCKAFVFPSPEGEGSNVPGCHFRFRL